MSFQPIAVVKTVLVEASAATGTVEVAFGSVTAGSVLVLIGGAIKNEGGDVTACLLSSVSGGGTWGNINNETSASWAPNAFVAVCNSATGGSTTATLTLNQSSANQIGVVGYEITLAHATPVEVIVEGSSVGGSSTSTAFTGALSQTDVLAILCATGWFGVPSNPSGWTQVATRQNGVSGYLGLHVCHQTRTSAASFQGTIAHESGSNTAATMVVIKAAAAGGSLRYKFEFDASKFTDADTGITGLVWHKANPDAQFARRYESLAGNATAGKLYITSDLHSGAAAGDALMGIFWNGPDTSGLITGVVEAV